MTALEHETETTTPTAKACEIGLCRELAEWRKVVVHLTDGQCVTRHVCHRHYLVTAAHVADIELERPVVCTRHDELSLVRWFKL